MAGGEGYCGCGADLCAGHIPGKRMKGICGEERPQRDPTGREECGLDAVPGLRCTPPGAMFTSSLRDDCG